MKLLADQAVRDPELVDLLADDPALLAIVDALYCTQRPETHRRVRVAVLLAAAVAALAAALALVAPWRSNAEVVSRALAAVGTRPVVHATIEQPLPGISTLDLGSGQLAPAATRIDVYFDAGRKLERIVSSSPLNETSDELHSATGDWVNGVPVLTCAWIAAHPAAAVKARVSCPSGSSTRPQPPTLDPALAAFASGYRAALRSGKARELGDGKVGGRLVHWLAIGSAERVAIDAKSLLPVLVQESEQGHPTSYRVLSFSTTQFSSADFARANPPSVPLPAGQSVRGNHAVTLAAARRALGGTLALPQHADGLRLSSAYVFDLLTGYAHKKPFQHSIELELLYRPDPGSVVIHEATEPDMIAGFNSETTLRQGEALILHSPGTSLAPDLAHPRAAALAISGWKGLIRIGHLYVTVEASSKPLLLRIVHDLKATR